MVKSVKTFGIAQTKSDIVLLEEKGRQWIWDKENERQPRLDLFEE